MTTLKLSHAFLFACWLVGRLRAVKRLEQFPHGTLRTEKSAIYYTIIFNISIHEWMVFERCTIIICWQLVFTIDNEVGECEQGDGAFTKGSQ